MSAPETATSASTTDVRFEEATPADDAAIRQLLRRTPMPGDVTVSFEREPSFFRSLAPMGTKTQVVVGRPMDDPDRVAALGCRTLQKAFVDGEAQRVEYLSQMRVDPDYRGQGLVERGFRKIRALHEADPVSYSYATITAANPAARKRLVERPTGAIPSFRPQSDLYTLSLILRRWGVPRPSFPSDITVSRGPDDLDAVTDFLQDAGADRPFFPVYGAGDFDSSGTLGIDPADLFIARRDGRIIGTLALWDVSDHKQTIIRGYRGPLRWTRPLVNAGLRLAGARPLPDPGEALRSLYASMVCAAPDHEDVYPALLDAAYRRAAATDAAVLIVGAAEDDPLLDAARAYWHVPYRSTFYSVHWTDDHPEPTLDERPPAVDVARL